MARIRTIKPEFPQSESMGRVSRDARLCFIMLWTVADDAGRLRGNSRMLASLLYPYDDDAKRLIDKWMAELEAEHCIQRYIANGDSYVQIVSWLEHQKIDKPSKSKFPEFQPSDGVREDSRGFSESSTTVREVSSEDQRKGMEGKGEELRASRLPADWVLPNEWAQWAKSERPDLDPTVTASGFADYWHSKAGKDARKTDWQATWRNWVRNERSAFRPTMAAPAPVRAVPSAEETKRRLAADDAVPLTDPEKRRAAIALAMGAVKTMGAA